MEPFESLHALLAVKPVSLYPASLCEIAEGHLCMADFGDFDGLLFVGEVCPFSAEETVTAEGKTLSRIALTHETAVLLRQLVPYTAPRSVLREDRSFGFGDRLGLAVEGHIGGLQDYEVLPVFAQQSMRELRLTGKTYMDVLDLVTFQVFRCGYRKGYGADGDHLKTIEDIRFAIGCGYTMITLDCSDHINNDAAAYTSEKLAALPPLSEELKSEYLGKPLIPGTEISFTEDDLHRAELIYHEAISFTKTVYDTCFAGTEVDLEISIDETLTPTTPAQHFFVVSQLKKLGVRFCTVAPRFCGEFQKGIDYMGSLEQFEAELVQHVAIAEHFGYKLSVHSGSDKFSVFPIIAKHVHGRFHVKTAGTSWLEAVRVVSMTDPAFFRELYAFAQTVYAEARTYYHVSTELEQVPDISGITDDRLPEVLNDPHGRQLMHITYGKILEPERPYRSRLFRLWREQRSVYDTLLRNHLGRHLDLLMGNS